MESHVPGPPSGIGRVGREWREGTVGIEGIESGERGERVLGGRVERWETGGREGSQSEQWGYCVPGGVRLNAQVHCLLSGVGEHGNS